MLTGSHLQGQERAKHRPPRSESGPPRWGLVLDHSGVSHTGCPEAVMWSPQPELSLGLVRDVAECTQVPGNMAHVAGSHRESWQTPRSAGRPWEFCGCATHGGMSE